MLKEKSELRKLDWRARELTAGELDLISGGNVAGGPVAGFPVIGHPPIIDPVFPGGAIPPDRTPVGGYI
jgi:hypothetical protein